MDTLREIDDAVEAIIRRAASRDAALGGDVDLLGIDGISESYEETADRIRDDHPTEAAEIDRLAQQWHDAEGDGAAGQYALYKPLIYGGK